jgi:SAM-dependent methyltransferase
MSQQMPWDNTYRQDKKVWGDNPSELAIFAGTFLKESSRFKNCADIFILDLGCGYARDAIFLAENLPCHVLGLDSSAQAIELGREALTRELGKRIELLCYDFSHVTDKYDVIFVSNLYHLLNQTERAKLRETIQRCLKTDGMLFLSTFSTRDPQHFGKGTPVEGETNSFIDDKFHHFSTRADLEKEFDFIRIAALFEREFHEPRANGNHHHILWLLMGERE